MKEAGLEGIIIRHGVVVVVASIKLIYIRKMPLSSTLI